MSAAILILGGGTFYHVRNHLSIAAPAFGTTARWLKENLVGSELVLTKMADSASSLETNADVKAFVDESLTKKTLRCLIMNVALCDYEGTIGHVASGKHVQRLQSRAGKQLMDLVPSDKVISSVKEQRPDILLVGFKTTTNFSPEEQQKAAYRMLSESKGDLVLANDTVTRHNLLINSKNECLIASKDRIEVLKRLVIEIKRT
jgi:phosphopantothenoylcysteine synthetase/decarboxylase